MKWESVARPNYAVEACITELEMKTKLAELTCNFVMVACKVLASTVFYHMYVINVNDR